MTEGYLRGFWHLWHLIILGFSKKLDHAFNTGGLTISWLEALKNQGTEATQETEIDTDAASSSATELSESLTHQGDKSAKSPPPSSDGEGTSDANIIDAKPKEARCTLVTSPEQLADVIANLKDVSLVALDLETTGLDPREDSIRLLSLATRAATCIVDCQSVDLAELFPILAERTIVAHNALFDLEFLTSLGLEPGKVADTMILSQLLYAGAKVEPLKRGQTSHSLVSVAMRELGIGLDKTHQCDDWDDTLTPEMIEYAARDVEILLPLYEVLKAMRQICRRFICDSSLCVRIGDT